MSEPLELKQTVNLPKTNFAQKANLGQSEPARLQKWKDAKLYEAILTARQGREKFILHDGPPYANADIHIGTALNKILKDFIVKSRSMMGFDAPYVPGYDCHGLPKRNQKSRTFIVGISQNLPRTRRARDGRADPRFFTARNFGRVGNAVSHDVERLRSGNGAAVRQISRTRLCV